jgi:3'-phosphoadenosine 5'-phosphosulfate sulfotransferase
VVDKLVKFLVTKQIELQKARTRLDILKLKQSITGALTPSEQTELDELQSNDISIASTKGADDDTPLHIDTKNDEDNSQKSSTLLSAQENEDNANTIMPAAITSAAVA